MNFGDYLSIAANSLGIGALYAIVGMGFNVVYISSRVFNFAQGEFFMLGVVGASVLLLAGWGILPTLAVVALALALVAVIEEPIAIRRFSRRPEEHTWILSTVGFSFLLLGIAEGRWGDQPTNFPQYLPSAALTFGGARVQPQSLLIVATAVALFWGASQLYRRTMLGKALIALSQDLDAAAAIGISKSRLTKVALAGSALMAAVAGMLAGPLTFASTQLGLGYAMKGFIAVALGGAGSVWGTLAGGLALGVIEGLGTTAVGGGYRDTFAWIVLLLVMLTKPQGVFGRAVEREV